MNEKERIQISVGCKLNLMQHLYFNQIVLPLVWKIIDEHIDAINALEEPIFEDLFDESEVN